MNMKIKSALLLLAGCALGVTLTTQLAAGPAAEAKGQPGAMGGMDMSKMTCPLTGEPMNMAMAQMMKDGTPGDAHKMLAQFVGTFDAKVKHFMPGMSEPMVGTGRFTSRAVHGGRFIMGDYTGEFMGQSFTGTSVLAFDNIEQRIESLWMDSMSTGVMSSTGDILPDGKGYTTTGSNRMNTSKGKMTLVSRQIVKIISPDSFVMEFYHTGGLTGESLKAMEITYTRVK